MQSETAENLNALTHGIGLLLSIVAGSYLMLRVVERHETVEILGCGVYAVALVAVYAASTLSHAFRVPARRHAMRRLDQGFIYFLIVGTYTPLSIGYLSSPGWWAFLALMWLVAIVGFAAKVFMGHRVDAVTLWSYVALGWMPILAAPALIRVAPEHILWWILLGGLAYTSGTIFLLLDKWKPHLHALWHLSVILGSGLHFFAILAIFTAES